MYELIVKLKALGAFWSYPSESLKNIPDSVLIEEALRMGDVEEIQQLFKLFPIQQIRDVWKRKVIPDGRIYAHNYYLARIFFNIKNPERYIKPLQKKYSRYEQIKKSVA